MKTTKKLSLEEAAKALQEMNQGIIILRCAWCVGAILTEKYPDTLVCPEGWRCRPDGENFIFESDNDGEWCFIGTHDKEWHLVVTPDKIHWSPA